MIACVCLSYFAASVERRANQLLLKQPLVLGGQPWANDPLYGFSQEAAGQGIRPGMALRQAHLLFPSATFMEATPPQYAAASAEIHDCLTDFAGRVEPRAWWQGSHSDDAFRPGGCHPACFPLVLLTRYAQHTLQAQLVAPDHPLPGQRFVWYTPTL